MNLYRRLWRDRKKLSRNPKIWLEYLCWCIGNWMDTHKPYYPRRLRRWLHGRYAPERFGTTQFQYRFWLSLGHDTDRIYQYRPLPWYVGPHAIGPFIPVWNAVARWFHHHRGGRSHRCEFTDFQKGALYGGQMGAFMDRLFEQFMKNIGAFND